MTIAKVRHHDNRVKGFSQFRRAADRESNKFVSCHSPHLDRARLPAMTSTCRLCAAQLARTVSKPTAVARSTAVLASSSSPASNASRLVRHATPVSPWSPVRSMHSSPARASALLSATRSPRAPLLSSTRMSPRRNIACAAEPPENPSADFEPVEEELQEGERLEMHLTDAAIKVSFGSFDARSFRATA